MALRARNHSPCGLATLNPESACHGRRRGPRLAPWRSGGLPACHGAESTRKTRGRKKEKCRCAKKTFSIIAIQGSPPGCVLHEIPGVTQFEKGHTGNTAVVTAYFCWVTHGNRSSRTGVHTEHVLLLIFALNIC